MMGKYTTDQLENMIKRHWNSGHIAFYFAQVLSGEESIEHTIEDLESFENKRGK